MADAEVKTPVAEGEAPEAADEAPKKPTTPSVRSST